MLFKILSRSRHLNFLLLFACYLCGCSDNTRDSSGVAPADSQGIQHNTEQSEIVAKETKNVADTKLILSKADDNGQYVYLGFLQFDESNRAKLTTEGTGPEVEKLERDWEEVSNLKELMWKQSVPDEVDGKHVMRVKGETVRPGDPDYIYAVLNTMERLYGYRAELAE